MTSTAPPRLLLVHAHPDDETLATGGTIARYAAQGVDVTLVTCTLGEEGEVLPAECSRLVSDQADQLGGYRVGELRSACAALRVADQRFLGGIGRWRDSGMVWDRPGVATAGATLHPRAFTADGFPEQVESLRAVVDEVRPHVVVTYAADGGYGHPDHIRAHEITMAATAESPDVRRVFHVVPSRTAVARGLAALAETDGLPFTLAPSDDLPGVEEDTITTEIDIADHMPAKISALQAHSTQVTVWLDEWDSGAGVGAYALTNEIAQPLLSTEHYVLASGDPEGCAEDLFGGLGWGSTEPVAAR